MSSSTPDIAPIPAIPRSRGKEQASQVLLTGNTSLALDALREFGFGDLEMSAADL